MLFGIFVGLVCVMGLFPDTPAARQLKTWLVDEPARILDELTFRRAAVWVALLVFMLIASVAAPEILLFLTSMGDAALAFEIWMMVCAAGLVSGGLGAWRTVKRFAASIAGAFASRSPGSGRSARPRSRRPPNRASRPGRKDDTDPGAGSPGWGYARIGMAS